MRLEVGASLTRIRIPSRSTSRHAFSSFGNFRTTRTEFMRETTMISRMIVNYAFADRTEFSVRTAQVPWPAPTSGWETAFPVAVSGYPPLGGPSLPSCNLMSPSSVQQTVLAADLFRNLPVRAQSEDPLASPGLCIRLRVVDGNVVYQRGMINAPEALPFATTE